MNDNEPKDETGPIQPPELPARKDSGEEKPPAAETDNSPSEGSSSSGPATETEPAAPIGFEPMDSDPTLATVVDALLKNPKRLLYEWQEGRQKPVVGNLCLICGAAFLLFGFLLGMFSGGPQLWIVPLKVLAGATIAALITLPSLYVFSSLGGFDMTLKKAAALLVSGLTLIGVILLGLAPVLWIFTQSTDSVGFMGFLVLVFWIASLGFGMSMILKNAKVFGNHSTGYLVLWAAIFVTVTLQMSTSLRPLLGPAEETILPTEKRFFLEHWVTTLTEATDRRNQDGE